MLCYMRLPLSIPRVLIFLKRVRKLPHGKGDLEGDLFKLEKPMFTGVGERGGLKSSSGLQWSIVRSVIHSSVVSFSRSFVYSIFRSFVYSVVLSSTCLNVSHAQTSSSELIHYSVLKFHPTDVRVGFCFDKFDENGCTNPKGREMRKSVCCCTMGAGWGDPCELCPRKNTCKCHINVGHMINIKT